jgi:hypothetical protein
MFGNKKDIIQFVSTIEGLENIEECKPRPAKFYMPEWFKDIPSKDPNTVKKCPSFPDFFSQGYVIPMWVDTKIIYNKELDYWGQESSIPGTDMSFHANSQLIDYVSPYFNGVKGNFVFKANSPWRIITPPGWSVLQLPMFYNFNQKWSVFPGIIDTDTIHQANQQILYHSDNEVVTINRGEPLAVYIPFKRKTLDLCVRAQTEKDRKLFRSIDLNIDSKFVGSGVYRKMQRDRDKNVR